jgi:hypothetical protein
LQTIECLYLDEFHTHEYPDDWRFGGANDIDPRADPRWQPTTYHYYNAELEEVALTQAPLCDEEALDKFTWHRELKPIYLAAKRPGNKKVELLPWRYDPASDTVNPTKKGEE